MARLNLLSDVECKSATTKGKAIRKLHDGGGLYLWVYADGRKYWRLRYKIAGSEKSLSLGVYPATVLKKARARRDEERQHLEANLDPAAERRAQKVRKLLGTANSFEAVAREWFGKQAKLWAPGHAEDVLRRLERNAFPSIGRRPISQIDAPELLAALRPMEERGAHDLSHRVLQVCGQVFRYGIATGRCTRNLAVDLRGALTPHRGRHQPAVRPEEFPELLRAIANYEKIGDKQTRLALELLALTFTRTNELIGSYWSEFDMDARIWTVPAGRMKMKLEHLVPLSAEALAILSELKDIGGGSRFVFPGRSRDKPISNNTLLFALYRLGFKGKMTGHGFRAVASTILNEMGKFRSDVIEKQLAHGEPNEVRSAYNRAEYLPERKKMMQIWATHINQLRKSATVISITRAVA